jgi:hypothetical protein
MGDANELPKEGDVIGVRYQIEKVLGQGGMGAVFAAVNQATGRAVAIKWMLPGAARSKESIDRFMAEARATAKIEHPNVIQILDVGQDNGAPFLVMERLRGGSLADRLEKFGRMTSEETLSVIIPACRGVAEAHTEGIIHRDLKPDNIFLCAGKDGSSRPPKVLDFGISKLYEEGGGQSMTRTGIAMGTPQYMSPEQLNAIGQPDARYDVYAMGIVLYECIAGRPPYQAEGLFELVQQIASGNPPPLRQIAPECPADLEQVILRAMHVHKDYRYATMPELIAELERVWARMQSGAPAPQVPIMPAYVPTGGQHVGMSPTGPVSQQWGAPPTAGYSQPGGGYTPPPTGPYQQPGGGYGYAPTGAMSPAMAAPAQSGGGSGMMIAMIGGGVVLLGLLVVVVAGVAIFALGGDDDEGSGGGGGGTLIGNTGGGGDVGNTGGGGDTGNTGNGPRTPQIGVTFTGDCAPRWNARLMVTGGGGSVNVMSSSLGGLTGSLMMNLGDIRGTSNISTAARTENQAAINVMVGQRLWTNMAIDSYAVSQGRIADPISGSVTVTSFDSDLATSDVTFHNVTLQNLQDGSICRLNGRLQTFGTTYGM